MAKGATSIQVEGRIERFLSGPTADGFAILKLTLPSNRSVTVKGKGLFSGYVRGDSIHIEGRSIQHPQYGEQIDAVDARPVERDEVAGLTRWIAEAGIEGVGTATAAKLVLVGGSKTLDAIIQDDAAMIQILGDRHAAVKAALMPRYGEAKFGAILAAHDIGRITRIKIYEAFGSETIKMLNDNPYALIHKVDGIAFQTADNIARKAGIGLTARTRIIAAIHAVLRNHETNGHSWASKATLIQDVAALCTIKPENIALVFEDLDIQEVVAIEVPQGNSIIEGYALARLAARETHISELVADKNDELSSMTAKQAQDYVTRASKAIGVTLNAEQKTAAIMALIEPISVITGNPGTGKTTVLSVITRALKLARKSIDVELAAPTGKAAQRMHEKTGHKARTIHRMLGADGKRFRYTAQTPLDADYIAIDEATMLDIDLAYALFQAWGGARVLLLGDVDQLPSVGAGRVFGDIIASGLVPVTRLTEIRRQGKGSGIALGAERIRAGLQPKWTDDFKFIEVNTNDEAARLVENLHNASAKAGVDVQVITPGHASEVGTRDLNRRLSETSGLTGIEVRIASGAPARIGDKVIQMANDSELDVYNGDTGRVTAITSKEGQSGIEVDIAGGESRTVHFDGLRMGELDLAYAYTIHKAQGSENDEIILPLVASHWMLLTRTMLNTAVTRAAKKCTIIGTKRALMRALANDDAASRRTQLRGLLELQVQQTELDYQVAA